jgi:hypothetical protein
MATKSEGKKRANKADSNQEHEAVSKSKAAHKDEETLAEGKKKSIQQESAQDEHAREADQKIDSSDLKALAEQLENDLYSMDNDAAIAIINRWHSALESYADEAFAGIVENLNQLKNMLTSDQTDGLSIADVLTDLSEEIIDYAEAKPPKGTKGSLKRLGNLLNELAESSASSFEEDETESEDDEEEEEE